MKKVLYILLVVGLLIGCADDDNGGNENGGGGSEWNVPTAEISVETAGTLSDLISADKKDEIKELRIIGELNGTDIKFIREMASLTHLDISKSKIVRGGDVYFSNTTGSYTTTNYVIGTAMFYNLRKLESIILPNNVIRIGLAAFSQCHALTSITIPDGVTEIRQAAFDGCSNLTSITIGDGVKRIDYTAFQLCDALKEIHIKATTPPHIGINHILSVDTSTCILYVPKGSSGLYQTTNIWSYFKNIIEE